MGSYSCRVMWGETRVFDCRFQAIDIVIDPLTGPRKEREWGALRRHRDLLIVKVGVASI